MTKAQKLMILVVEDEPATGEVIEQALKAEGYEVRVARSLFQAKGVLARVWPDLLILDRKLPDGDGLEFCQEVRSDIRSKALPIMFLTDKKTLTEKVMGLHMGGDDYLTKPFAAEELAARVSALFRRVRGEEPEKPILKAGDLEMDLETRRVLLKGQPLHLRPKEFDVLEMFLRRRNAVLTRAFLLERLWGYEEAANLNPKVVNVTVGSLRDKLGEFGKCIVPVRNRGYQFEWTKG